ncbi:MAG: zinc metallopeptidase [Oscillospiraceae bacterium]|nr:zinc metallopeptidase [Oscillospiraceae bacterium]
MLNFYFYGWGFIVLGTVISMVASFNVKRTFAKYSKVQSRDRTTAEEVSEAILRNAGVHDVKVEHVRGNLTDHYDPRVKSVRLSDAVYGKISVASIGVAAHECGHAIQHNGSYAPLAFRNKLLPVTNFGSSMSGPLIFSGFFFSMPALLDWGIILFCAVILFQLITLPVEFNASARACEILESTGRYEGEELKDVRKVLNAAALTYVAALLVSLLNLIRLIGLRNKR